MLDIYKILDVNFEASEVEIKKKYRELALIHHPDKNCGSKKSEEIFKEITSAYEILSDSEKRALYDIKYKLYFHKSTTENTNNETSVNQSPSSNSSVKSKSESKYGIKIVKHNYSIWFIILIIIIIYLIYSNSEGNLNGINRQQIERQQEEIRPQSGEIDFNK